MNHDDFEPIVIGKLLNIGGLIHRKANQLLLPENLNQQQFSILFEIFKAEKVTQKNLINRLVLKKAHVSKVIKKLSEMNLIQVQADKGDKRVSWLSVTPTGNETVKRCRRTFFDWNQEWSREIEPDQRKAILESLTLLQSIFKEKARVD